MRISEGASNHGRSRRKGAKAKSRAGDRCEFRKEDFAEWFTAQSPEKAMYVSALTDLKYFDGAVFQRIYFGNEFCEHLIPNAPELRDAVAFARDAGAAFTFVTPYCTNEILRRISALLNVLPKGAEVVFNDWGLLNGIREKGLIPVHGRLMCTIRKDPRTSAVSEYNDFFRSNNLLEAYQELLLKNGVRRIELDNVNQGYNLKPLADIVTSLYFPFVACTVTRKCIFANMRAGNVKPHVAVKCGGCRLNPNLVLKLGGKDVHIEGNAQYYINEKMPDEYAGWKVDRVVFMPRFPNHRE